MRDFMNMMKQAQEMQGKMQAMQEDLASMEIIGEAGGGMVKVTLSGKGDMKSLAFDDAMMKPGEREILEDLIVAAHNDAKAKMEAAAAEKMKEVTGDLQLPAGMNPFG